MKEGTIRTMRRPRKLEHDIQNIAGNGQNRGCGFVGRPLIIIFTKTLLQATQFRILLIAKTRRRTVVYIKRLYANTSAIWKAAHLHHINSLRVRA